jgi:PIN domain nuclease of toxin-antitoxin system
MPLLDTHVWIWLVDGHRRMVRKRRTRIEVADCYVSAASVFEIGQLATTRGLQFRPSVREWIAGSLSAYSISVIPIDDRIALRAADFTNALRDPVDCLIAATAVTHDLELITADERLRALPSIPTSW